MIKPDGFWPDEVPVLRVKDIFQGGLNGPDGTHCMLGWASSARIPGAWKTDGDFSKAMLQSARELNAPVKSRQAALVNDDNPRRIVARIWNRAMAKLGYVVNNPEAKYLKQRKK